MTGLIIVTVQYLPFLIPLVAALAWLTLPPCRETMVALGLRPARGRPLVGIARVAAHVHHLQDIVAGLLLAAAAVGVTKAVWHWAARACTPVTPDGAARG